MYEGIMVGKIDGIKEYLGLHPNCKIIGVKINGDVLEFRFVSKTKYEGTVELNSSQKPMKFTTVE